IYVFWKDANFITSKDDYITKTQIQYLESELCRLVLETGNASVHNGTQPSKPNLSEVDTAEMKQFLEVNKLILSSVGINILDSKKKLREDTNEQKEQMIFEFTLKGAQAQMIIEDDQFVILKGSTAVRNYRPSASDSIKKMRENLISKN